MGRKYEFYVRVADLSALISNIKNSIVCSCFGQSISHFRGKLRVVVMDFFYRSEKNITIIREKLVFKFVHKNSKVNGYFIKLI